MTWLDDYQELSGVRLNLVAGAVGQLVDHKGSSRGLSNEFDRALIRHLRALSDVYVTGGNTARIEGYKSPARGSLAVITRGEFELPGAITLTPPTGQDVATWTLSKLRELGYKRILLEVGPSLAKHFFAANLIDELCLTLPSAKLAVGKELVSKLSSTLKLSEANSIEGTLFTRWRRGNDSVA
jgi:riboflavin biosynthesis pyrimidine reductase